MDQAWHSDPTGRHQLRWFDGSDWTDHVADDGVTSSDPIAGSGTAAWPQTQEPVSTGARSGTATSSATSAPTATAAPPSTTASDEWAPAGWSASEGDGGAQAPVGSWSGSSNAPSSPTRGGVRALWVVIIAFVALGIGGVIGFVVGVAVDVGGDITSEFDINSDFDAGSAADAVDGQPIDVGTVVTGSSGDDGVAHPLTISSTTSLRLETIDGDFDTVIDVYDASGVQVDSDDDGGAAPLSRLVVTLEPGTYEVVVRPFAFSGGGDYTLEVAAS